MILSWFGFIVVTLSWFIVMLLLISVARRILGVRVGFLRTLLGAVIGWLVAGSIVRSLPAVSGAGPAIGLLVPIAGSALVATLLFLFIAEFVRPSGMGWGVRGWPRALVRRWRRSRRYARILRIAAAHGLGGYLGGRGGTDDDAPVRRMRLARSLRAALEEGGVTFVKLGQLLSTRTDLLPPEFTSELAKLQHNASRVGNAETLAVLRAELGREVSEVFSEFGPEPLAAASIAQVYPARRIDGAEVAVKVQRPGIRATVEQDLDILDRVAKSLDARAEWARRLGVRELAAGFAVALIEELDFTTEARNLDAVRAADTTAVITLPRLYESTERVLVTERLHGTPLEAGATVPNAEELADKLLATVLRQLMAHGIFHADPHPGNVLVLEDGGLALLDFGSVGRIDAALRSGLRAFLLGIDAGDAGAMRDALLEILTRPDEVDEQQLERALGRLAAKHFSGSQRPDAELFTDLFALISRHGLAVPPEMAAVFRALATLEGTLATLCPGFNIVLRSRSLAGKQVSEALSDGSVRTALTRELLATLPILRKLPRRIDRVSSALEQGRLSVNVRLLADSRDRTMLRSALHELLLALLGATTGVMAALLLTSAAAGPQITKGVGLNQLFGYNLLVISALVGVRLLFAVFRNQHHRNQR